MDFTRQQQRAAIDRLRRTCEVAADGAAPALRDLALEPARVAQAYFDCGDMRVLFKCPLEMRRLLILEVLREERLARRLLGESLDELDRQRGRSAADVEATIAAPVAPTK